MRAELVIIGAGPGGLAAALEAVNAGVQVTILDENPKAGGQIFRQMEDGFKVVDPTALGRDYPRGRKLLQAFKNVASRIDYRPEAVVWGLFEDRELTFGQNDSAGRMRYDRLIVAPGAYDRPVPFPGWTLPGVMTAGAAQRLVKNQRVLPGRKMLLAGSGPLQLVLAYQMVKAGGTVAGLLEAGRLWKHWKLSPLLLNGLATLVDGYVYWRALQKARVPVMFGHMVVEARGNGRLEEVVIAEVDESWRPLSNTRRTIPADVLCLGYGLISSSELTLLVGCRHEYLAKAGGWTPCRNGRMETSVSGVYAVGDGSGVAGFEAARAEGALAGIAAAHSLGRLSSMQAESRSRPHRRKLSRIERFHRVLDAFSAPGPGLYELADDDTIVCRCEDVTVGRIREALARGCGDLNELKRRTRQGMGRCQGRICGQVVKEMLGWGQGAKRGGPLKPRPPVKPITVSNMAQLDSVETHDPGNI